MNASLAVLRDPNSSRLFYGQLLSQVCERMMSVGLVWVLLERGDGRIVPWFLGAATLPHLLLGFHSARVTRALGPLRTIVGADVFRGVVFLALALLFPFVGPAREVPVLFAFAFLSGLGGAFFNPAIMSLPVFLKEKDLIQQVTALVDACFAFGNVLGPLLSALLYPVLGLRGLFLVNGASYLVAALVEAGIEVDDVAAASTTATSEAAHAARADDDRRHVLRRDPFLLFLLAGYLGINLFLAPLSVFLPLFVKTRYEGQLGTLAWLDTSWAIGMTAGAAALSVLSARWRMGTTLGAGMIAVAVAYLGFVSTGNALVAGAWLVVLGVALAVVNVFSLNLLQRRPRPDDVPTVMSLVNLISVASVPVSMLVVGYCVERVTVDRLGLIFGGMLLVTTLIVASNRKLRSL